MVLVGWFPFLVAGRCDYLCRVTVEVFEAFGEICRVLIGIFYDGYAQVLVVFSDLWKDGIQIANDFIGELLYMLEYVSGTDMLPIGIRGCHGSMSELSIHRSQSNLFPCTKQLDEPFRHVVSYFGGFFPMYFHHVVQAVSPAIGANDVRSCREIEISARLPV